ncbi:MAG: phospholipase D-like domain-containing protein [Elusimicrobiaceae bacterium]
MNSLYGFISFHPEAFSLTVATLLHIGLSILITGHILLHKKDIKSSIGWIGLVWLSPLVGSVCYVFFGINRITRKALSMRRKGPESSGSLAAAAGELLETLPRESARFLKFGYAVHPQEFTFGNSVTPLQNGDEAYPAMLAEIENAKKEILFSSYIFNNDRAGSMFLAPLRAAAERGVKVKVLVDGVGVRYGKPTIEKEFRKTRDLGFELFLPIHAPFALPFFNLRSHRKLIVIDGHTSFIGGMNIAEGNLLKTEPAFGIQDITFRVKGPVTGQIARIFEEDWFFASGKKFRPEAVRDEKQGFGDIACRAIPDGPDSDIGKIEWMLLGAIACAEEKITIVTPYFLPDANMLSAIRVAAMRGVEVELILPLKSNIYGMDWAMESNFAALLASGVKIWQAPPPFDHSKIAVVDGQWSFVGSANWDVRSLRLNFEANLECLSGEFAAKLLKTAEDKKRSAALLKHKKHGLWRVLRNNAFRLLTPYY